MVLGYKTHAGLIRCEPACHGAHDDIDDRRFGANPGTNHPERQVEWFLGILGCLFLLVVLLPLIPIFELYDDVRRAYEDR